jgi:hypothetical protein
LVLEGFEYILKEEIGMYLYMLSEVKVIFYIAQQSDNEQKLKLRQTFQSAKKLRISPLPV